MRITVIGSTGQLGTDLVAVLRDPDAAYEVAALGPEDVEVADAGSVNRALETARPDVVVNCAAFVRVDDCEDQVEEAFRVNAVGALHVARACAARNALCVFISTDYVFDGERGGGYTEDDCPRPVNVYGASKLAGEHLVRQACPTWTIVRMASLFGKAGALGKGGNFVETILAKAKAGETLRVVSDVRMSPTYAADAARALERLLRAGRTGLFHVTNRGSCTWHQFASKALELAGLKTEVQAISTLEWGARARRPRNSALRSVRLDDSGAEVLRQWPDALRAYLAEKGHIRP